MEVKNLYSPLPERRDQEDFLQLFANDSVTIERIVSKGHVSPVSGWYDQNQGEWVVVLKGGATLAFADGEDVSLGEGDYMYIPPRCQHRVSWTDPQVETIWLAVHC